MLAQQPELKGELRFANFFLLGPHSLLATLYLAKDASAKKSKRKSGRS